MTEMAEVQQTPSTTTASDNTKAKYFFSPNDMRIPIDNLKERLEHIVQLLDAARWESVFARILQETKCSTNEELAHWLFVSVEEVRRVVEQKKRLPYKWIVNLAICGWIHPLWILYGRKPKLLTNEDVSQDQDPETLEKHINTISEAIEKVVEYSKYFILVPLQDKSLEQYEKIRSEFKARKPEGVESFFMAELWEEEEKEERRCMLKRRVFLGWSHHTNDTFGELRNAAERFSPTAFLAAAPEAYQRRQPYTLSKEGEESFGYVADTPYGQPGWKIRKVWIDEHTDTDLEWDAKE